MDENGRIEPIMAAREEYGREMERRVRSAIEGLVAQGKAPSFYAVADAAHVARSTLYRKGELKKLVDQARKSFVEQPSATGRSEELERENALLRDELRHVSRERDELERICRVRTSYWMVPFGEAA